MANSRGNPFEELIGDLTRGFWVKPTGFNSPAQYRTDAGIRIDVREDEKSFMVKADIPGVRKEDIQVQIDEDRVSLRAQAV